MIPLHVVHVFGVITWTQLKTKKKPGKIKETKKSVPHKMAQLSFPIL